MKGFFFDKGIRQQVFIKYRKKIFITANFFYIKEMMMKRHVLIAVANSAWLRTLPNINAQTESGNDRCGEHGDIDTRTKPNT